MEETLAPVTAEEIRGWLARVASAPVGGDDVELVDQTTVMESLKCALEARQARVAIAFDASQRAAAAARGVRSERQGKGVAEQLALARRVSPHRGRILLGLAKSVVGEMPWTARAWAEGRISERRAIILAKETACLSVEDRARVDLDLASDPDRLEAKSDRLVEGQARALAAKLDAASVAERRRRAEAERCVTIRPAPDSMVYLTALLPVAQGVAAYAALSRAADTAVAAGDERSRGQLMADTLAGRIAQVAEDAASGAPVVPVGINLVMSDRALFAGAGDPAEISGYGPIAAGHARELIADAVDAGLKTWLKRLYAHPVTGRLVAMDSRQRLFPKQLAEVLQLRDRFCRNPWCNARIRHSDHIEPAAAGGQTSAANGQGLCEACNQVKDQPGWSYRPVDEPGGGAHTVEITTPTGHVYRSTAPPMPGSGLEIEYGRIIAA